MCRYLCGIMLAIGAATLFSATSVAQDWQVVVNNGTQVPGDQRNFNSYNPPAVNVFQTIVFRGRSKGGSGGSGGQPAHGVFLRDMYQGSGIVTLLDRSTAVPSPNNLGATFIEPPSIPRIDIWSDTVATRGVHSPVLQYVVPTEATTIEEAEEEEEETTRAGTTGIYTNPFGSLQTGMSNLGLAPGYEHFAVPGHEGTKFDVFPGAPAVVDGDVIVFKGNYVAEVDGEALGFTGVYYRFLTDPAAGDGQDLGEEAAQDVEQAGDELPVILIASSEVSTIPGTTLPFGSTAPPSAAVGPPPDYESMLAVFAGFDNEESPTAGGIYLVELNGPQPPLVPLVEIGSSVPGVKGGTFNRIGEGLSFDGRFVAFWGAWGTQTNFITLCCPEDGNRDRIEYCLENYPDGLVVEVPVNQGIFVHDIVTRTTQAIATAPADFDDFLFWNFSGRVPGTGEADDDGEPPRWRSAAFLAVSSLVNPTQRDVGAHVAFKARTWLGLEEEAAMDVPVDGIYLRRVPGNRPFETLVETGMPGTLFDPAATYGGSSLPVTEMGIERDGFRGNTLAVAITMGTEEAGWAGIYMTEIKGKPRKATQQAKSR